MNDLSATNHVPEVLDDEVAAAPMDQRAITGVVLAIAFNILVVLTTLFWPTFVTSDVFLSLIGLGISFGQIGLLSLWCALGDAPRPHRIFSALVGVALSCSYLIVLLWKVFGDIEIGWFFSIVLLAQFFLLQIALCTIGLCRNWHVGFRPPRSAAITASQFGIKDLLIWVTAFAVIMGIGRLATRSLDFGFLLETESERVLKLVAVAFCSTFLCMISGISVLVRYRLFSALLFGTMSIAVVCGIEIVVVSIIEGSWYESAQQISIAHAVNLLLMVASLFMLRMSGLRFWIGL